MAINLKKMNELGKKVLAEVGIDESAEVGLFFVSDRKIKKLNKKYRKINKATDVLSFPLEKISCRVSCINDQAGQKKKEKDNHRKDINQAVCEIQCNPEFSGKLFLGDVVISEQTAKKQARQHKKSYAEEIEFLFVHGLLHLCGLDHEKGEKEERAWDNIAKKFC